MCNYLRCLGSSVGVIKCGGPPMPHLFRFPKNNTSSSSCQAHARHTRRIHHGLQRLGWPRRALAEDQGLYQPGRTHAQLRVAAHSAGKSHPQTWQHWQAHPQLPLSLAQLLANQIRRHALTSHLLPEETSTLISETRQGPSGPRLMPENSSRGPCEIGDDGRCRALHSGGPGRVGEPWS